MIPSFPSVPPECAVTCGLTPPVAAGDWPAGMTLPSGTTVPSTAVFARLLGTPSPVSVAVASRRVVPAAVMASSPAPAAPADSRSAEFASSWPVASEILVANSPVAPRSAAQPPGRAEVEAACALLVPLLQLGTPIAVPPADPVSGMETASPSTMAKGTGLLPRTEGGDVTLASGHPPAADSFSPPASSHGRAEGGAIAGTASVRAEDASEAGARGVPPPSLRPPVSPEPGNAERPHQAPDDALPARSAAPDRLAPRPGPARTDRAAPALAVSPEALPTVSVESAAPGAPGAPDAPVVIAVPFAPAMPAGPVAMPPSAPRQSDALVSSPRPGVEILTASGAGATSAAAVPATSVAVETPEGIQIFATLLPATPRAAWRDAATGVSRAERPVAAMPAASADLPAAAPVAAPPSARARSTAGTDMPPLANPSAAANPAPFAEASRTGAPVSGQVRLGSVERPAISAAPAVAVVSAETAEVSTPEKKSLTPRATSVKPSALEAGIAVAQEQPAMPSTVIAPTSAAPVSAMRAEAIAMPVAPMSFPTDEAAAPSAGAALAQRAVEAVETVVDAQAAARLEPTPGVALRFRAGHEELAVRIEWRAGRVHTEFRTDSEEWRAAVAHEWRAVTARPDSPLRSAEAVFAPAGGSSDNSSAPGFPSHSGQSSSQQQQQSQHQQQAAGREAPEIFGRVGRRFPATASSPATPVAAAAPLGAHRLSAVA